MGLAILVTLRAVRRTGPKIIV